MSAELQWVTRDRLPATQAEHAVVALDDPAEAPLAISPRALAALRAESARAWQAAGIADGQRVLVSLARQGELPVAVGADVLAPLCAAVGAAAPRGRLRLLKTMKAFRPDVWVTTPCAALDFLARLYMEFNVDPFDLGLSRIVLVGEVASPGTRKRLADEFESEVVDVYCDPVFGAALAVRKYGGELQVTSGALRLAHSQRDELLTDGAEIALQFDEIEELAGLVIRSGQVCAAPEAEGIFSGTTGDHVLVRGRWLSLPLFEQSLKLIDGISYWHLAVERGEGTLDRVTLKVGLNRESLVENPMWKARIREAVAAVTPVRVEVECYLLTEDDEFPPARVEDLRGHHRSRDEVAAGRSQ